MLLVNSPQEFMHSRGLYDYIYNCRSPQVYYKGEEIKNLESELARAAKLKCSTCGQKGAALGCFVKSCRKSYHLPCALNLDCRWDSVS